jgi:hypothetical protein
VTPLNVAETKAAEELLPGAGCGGGYLLGDGESDANPVFDAAGGAGYQLVAPREKAKAGLGDRRQSPNRLRCIERLRGAFGRDLYAMRGAIERSFGNATSFGGGLSPLPAWVRRSWQVWRWVCAKLLINAVRIVYRQRLTLQME